jgi:high-affinity Fe2+/Pb2+ permease
MQMAQPTASPLGKLQTLGRMAIAFVVTVLLIMVTGAILRRGDPQALGAIAGLVALLVAVIAGWWHTRALNAAARERLKPETRNQKLENGKSEEKADSSLRSE